MRCIALLGGSFDPVHQGHVELGVFFANLLGADGLRIIPTGKSAFKQPLQATAADRLSMLRLAFDGQTIAVHLDEQEMVRDGVTYTIDTLRSLRAEYGADTSLVFLIGFDQLQQLHTWHEWQQLFDYAHICVAARPGFSVDSDLASYASQLPPEVAEVFFQRSATVEQIRNTAHGYTYLASELAIDVSSTAIRAALQRGEMPAQAVPATVLAYIQQHDLYKN